MMKFNVLRAADLHLAYQHGEATANGDPTSEAEFHEKFAANEEAQAEYVRGFAAQTALKLKADIDCGDPPEYAVSFVGSMPMVRSDLPRENKRLTDTEAAARRFVIFTQSAFNTGTPAESICEDLASDPYCLDKSAALLVIDALVKVGQLALADGAKDAYFVPDTVRA